MAALVEVFVALVFSFGVSVVGNTVGAVSTGVLGSVLVITTCGFEPSGL